MLGDFNILLRVPCIQDIIPNTCNAIRIASIDFEENYFPLVDASSHVFVLYVDGVLHIGEGGQCLELSFSSIKGEWELERGRTPGMREEVSPREENHLARETQKCGKNFSEEKGEVAQDKRGNFYKEKNGDR